MNPSKGQTAHLPLTVCSLPHYDHSWHSCSCSSSYLCQTLYWFLTDLFALIWMVQILGWFVLRKGGFRCIWNDVSQMNDDLSVCMERCQWTVLRRLSWLTLLRLCLLLHHVSCMHLFVWQLAILFSLVQSDGFFSVSGFPTGNYTNQEYWKKRGSINFIDPNGNPQHDQLEIFPVIFGLQMWHLLIVEVGRWDVGGWLALPEEEGLTLSCFCLESMTKEPNNGKKRESKSSSER